MYSNNKYDGINPIIVSIVRRKAHQLCNSKYFTKADFEDLEQELITHLLCQNNRYESNQFSSNEVYEIVNNKAIDLIRASSRKKRKPKTRMQFLHDSISIQDNEYLLIDFISTEQYFDDYYIEDPIEYIDSEIDFKRIIDQLPTDLKILCQLLEDMSISEVIQITGQSSRTVYKKIKKLRKILIENYSYHSK